MKERKCPACNVLCEDVGEYDSFWPRDYRCPKCGSIFDGDTGDCIESVNMKKPDHTLQVALVVFKMQNKLGRGASYMELREEMLKYQEFGHTAMYLERDLWMLRELDIVDHEWYNNGKNWIRIYFINDESINMIKRLSEKEQTL